MLRDKKNNKFNKHIGYHSFCGFLKSSVFLTKKGNLDRVELNFTPISSECERDDNEIM